MKLAGLLIVLLSTTVAAADFDGLSAFASTANRYPCNRALAIMKQAKHPAMAILYGTDWGNNNDYECAKRFLSTISKPRLLQVHFSNEAGRRKRKLGVGDVFPQDSVSRLNERYEEMDQETALIVAERVKEIRFKFEPYCLEDCQLALSTGLEDNYSLLAYRNLLGVIQDNWPYLVVRNPCKGSKSKLTAHLKETHSLNSSTKQACIANEDGNQNQSKNDTKRFFRRYRSCYARFIWRAKHQGNFGRWTPRQKRKLEIPATDVTKLGRILAAQ